MNKGYGEMWTTEDTMDSVRRLFKRKLDLIFYTILALILSKKRENLGISWFVLYVSYLECPVSRLQSEKCNVLFTYTRKELYSDLSRQGSSRLSCERNSTHEYSWLRSSVKEILITFQLTHEIGEWMKHFSLRIRWIYFRFLWCSVIGPLWKLLSG